MTLIQPLIQFVKPHAIKLLSFLINHFQSFSEIEVEGNGKKLKAKIKNPEDLEKLIKSMKEFIN
jgi:hypothetical protein